MGRPSKPMIRKECVVCGHPFLTTDARHLTCCRECSAVHLRDYNRAAKAKEKEARQKTKTCAICGAVFSTGRDFQVCCSKECSREYNRKRSINYYHRHSASRENRKRVKKIVRETGVTEERMAEIAFAQDCGDTKYLARHAASWTPAEHKYARQRYLQVYM